MTATLIRISIAAIVAAFLCGMAWLTSYPSTSIIAFILIVLLWGLVLLHAILPAIAIYAPEYNSRIRATFFRFLIVFNPSKFQILGHIAFSYLTTMYLFAVIFRAVCNFDSSAFNPTIDSLGTATYFSIVTLATVGYGDILPVSGFARFVVSIEILVGVAYGVFFLSTIASFLRER